VSGRREASGSSSFPSFFLLPSQSFPRFSPGAACQTTSLSSYPWTRVRCQVKARDDQTVSFSSSSFPFQEPSLISSSFLLSSLSIDHEVQAPPVSVKFERSPSISSMSGRRDRNDRSASSSSSPPPRPPASKTPVSAYNKFEAKAALQRQQAAAAASSVASSSKRSRNAVASSSKSTSNVLSSFKRRVSDPSSSKASTSKSSIASAPKPRKSDPVLPSRAKPSSNPRLVAGGSTFTKSLAERPSVTSGRSVRVEGSNVARFLEHEAWEAFSQFGQM